MPLFGPPDIQKLKEKRDVKGLKNALDYGLKRKDLEYILNAAFALAEFNFYSPALAVGVKNRDWKTRQKTYGYYAKFVLPGFIPLLVALHDEQEQVRLTAITALLLRAEKRAVKPLVDCLLYDPSKYVRQSAVIALRKLAGSEILEALLKARNDPEPDVRKEVNEALASLGY